MLLIPFAALFLALLWLCDGRRLFPSECLRLLLVAVQQFRPLRLLRFDHLNRGGVLGRRSADTGGDVGVAELWPGDGHRERGQAFPADRGADVAVVGGLADEVFF